MSFLVLRLVSNSFPTTPSRCCAPSDLSTQHGSPHTTIRTAPEYHSTTSEGVFVCSLPITLPPHLVMHIATNFNVWDVTLQILENSLKYVTKSKSFRTPSRTMCLKCMQRYQERASSSVFGDNNSPVLARWRVKGYGRWPFAQLSEMEHHLHPIMAGIRSTCWSLGLVYYSRK